MNRIVPILLLWMILGCSCTSSDEKHIKILWTNWGLNLPINRIPIMLSSFRETVVEVVYKTLLMKLKSLTILPMSLSVIRKRISIFNREEEGIFI